MSHYIKASLRSLCQQLPTIWSGLYHKQPDMKAAAIGTISAKDLPGQCHCMQCFSVVNATILAAEGCKTHDEHTTVSISCKLPKPNYHTIIHTKATCWLCTCMVATWGSGAESPGKPLGTSHWSSGSAEHLHGRLAVGCPPCGQRQPCGGWWHHPHHPLHSHHTPA